MRLLGLAGNIGAGKDSVAELLVRDHAFVSVALADPLKHLTRRLFQVSDDALFGPSALRNAPLPEAADPAWWERVYARTDGPYRQNLLDLFAYAPTELTATQILGPLRKEFAGFRALGGALTPRFILQRLGTDWARALWPGVWLHETERVLKMIRQGYRYTRMGGLGGLRTFEDPVPGGIVLTDVRFPNEGVEVWKWLGTLVWVDASQRAPLPSHLRHASEPSREDFGPGVKVLDNNGPLEALRGLVAGLLQPVGG